MAEDAVCYSPARGARHVDCEEDIFEGEQGEFHAKRFGERGGAECVDFAAKGWKHDHFLVLFRYLHKMSHYWPAFSHN